VKKVRSELIERFVSRRAFKNLDAETEAVWNALVRILNGESPDRALGIDRKRGYEPSANWSNPLFQLARQVRDWQAQKAQGKTNEDIEELANEWLKNPPVQYSGDRRSKLPKSMSEKTVRELPRRFAAEIEQYDVLKAMVEDDAAHRAA